MASYRPLFYNPIVYCKIKKDFNVLKQKTLKLCSLDDRPYMTAKFLLNEEKPYNVFFSQNILNYEDIREPIYSFNCDIIEDLLEDKVLMRTIKRKLKLYNIDVSKIKKSLKEKEKYKQCILYHVQFVKLLISNFEETKEKPKYEIESEEFHEKIVNVSFLNDTINLDQIFETINVFSTVPLVKLSVNNQNFTKLYQPNNSDFCKEFEELDFGTSFLRSEINKRDVKHDYISVYKLNFRNDTDKEEVCFEKVIHLYKMKNNRYGLQAYLQKDTIFSTINRVLEYLNLTETKNIEKELYYAGTFYLSLSSLDIFEDRIVFSCNESLLGKCQNCGENFELDSEVCKLSEKDKAEYCYLCYQKITIENCIRNLINFSFIDCLIGHCFSYPNFSQLDSKVNQDEVKYNLIYRSYNFHPYPDYIVSNIDKKKFVSSRDLRVKFSIDEKNRFKLAIKKSLSREHVNDFIKFFLQTLTIIKKRKKFYFFHIDDNNNINEKDTTSDYFSINKEMITCNRIISFDRTKIEDDLQAGNNMDLNLRLICSEPVFDEEEKCKNDARILLKEFLYTRYVSKERMPEFSFKKPEPAEDYHILEWPPKEKFNSNILFVKSSKYEQIIKIIWNQQYGDLARFQMFIQEDECNKCNIPTSYDDKSLERQRKKRYLKDNEFKTIYFYIRKKNAKKFLSVTNLSPAFLPSLTIKSKTTKNSFETNYEKKQHCKLNSYINAFLKEFLDFELKDRVTFHIKNKQTLWSMLNNNPNVNLKRLYTSYQELIFKEKKLNDPKLFDDITNVYCYISRLFSSNIIVINIKSKNTSEGIEFNNILPVPLDTFIFNRFLILVESIDEKNPDGIVQYHYQRIFLKDSHNDDGEKAFITRDNFPQLFDSLSKIYSAVILKEPIKESRRFNENLKQIERFSETQIINWQGKVKLLIFQKFTLFFENDTNLFPPFSNTPTKTHFLFKNLHDDSVQDFDMNSLTIYMKEFFNMIFEVNVSTSICRWKENIYFLSGEFYFENLPEEKFQCKVFFQKKNTLMNDNYQDTKLPQMEFYQKKDHDVFLDLNKSREVNRNLKQLLLVEFKKFFMNENKNKNFEMDSIVTKFVRKVDFKEDDIFSKRSFKQKNIDLVLPKGYKKNLKNFLSWVAMNMNSFTEISNKFTSKSKSSFSFSQKPETSIREL